MLKYYVFKVVINVQTANTKKIRVQNGCVDNLTGFFLRFHENFP